MLRNQWYAILSAHELPPDRPLGVTRFGQPLVFWRDHGQVCCVSDICPHLGAALSGGKICQGKIQCPFHGFEFQGDGQCTHIPANGPEGRIPKGMVATAYVDGDITAEQLSIDVGAFFQGRVAQGQRQAPAPAPVAPVAPQPTPAPAAEAKADVVALKPNA